MPVRPITCRGNKVDNIAVISMIDDDYCDGDTNYANHARCVTSRKGTMVDAEVY